METVRVINTGSSGRRTKKTGSLASKNGAGFQFDPSGIVTGSAENGGAVANPRAASPAAGTNLCNWYTTPTLASEQALWGTVGTGEGRVKGLRASSLRDCGDGGRESKRPASKFSEGLWGQGTADSGREKNCGRFARKSICPTSFVRTLVDSPMTYNTLQHGEHTFPCLFSFFRLN